MDTDKLCIKCRTHDYSMDSMIAIKYWPKDLYHKLKRLCSRCLLAFEKMLPSGANFPWRKYEQILQTFIKGGYDTVSACSVRESLVRCMGPGHGKSLKDYRRIPSTQLVRLWSTASFRY